MLHYQKEKPHCRILPTPMSQSERKEVTRRAAARMTPEDKERKRKINQVKFARKLGPAYIPNLHQGVRTLGQATTSMGSGEGSSKQPSSGPVHGTDGGKTHPSVAQNPTVVTDTDTRPPHPPATGLSKKGKGTLTSDKITGEGSTPQTTSQQQRSADHDHLRGASGSGQTSDHPPVQTRMRKQRKQSVTSRPNVQPRPKAQQQQAQQQHVQQQQETQRSLSTSSTQTQRVRRLCEIL